MPPRIRRLFRDARSWLALAPIRSKYWRSSFRAAKILCFSYGHLRSVRAGSPVDAAGQPIPWYTYPAIDFLRQLDLSERTVFEYRLGQFDIVLGRARRAGSQRRRRRGLVGTFEEHGTRELHHRAGSRSHRYPHVIDSYPEEFDIIVVDGPARGATRVRCARAALKRLKAGGMLDPDNNDLAGQSSAFPEAEPAIERMSGHARCAIHEEPTSGNLLHVRRFRCRSKSTGQRPPSLTPATGNVTT